jgi:7-cyano-7-deazaguanine synthase in queuosine biosynthesis
MDAVVLLSGGLDSYTAAAIAKAGGFVLNALTIHYGQRHVREVEAARKEFGDAELASLIAPRGLIVEACAVPKINNVGPVREGPHRAWR